MKKQARNRITGKNNRANSPEFFAGTETGEGKNAGEARSGSEFANDQVRNNQAQESTKLLLNDKNGKALNAKDVLSREGVYYCIHPDKGDGVTMISCTHGYIHNATQETLLDFEFVGNFESSKHHLECD